jgi:tetratricopeptide (TPR) repeat protein
MLIKITLPFFLAASLLVPAAAADTTQRCRELLKALSADEGGGYDSAFFSNADAAFRECRDAKVAAPVRAEAMAKYASAEVARGHVQTAIAAYGEALGVLDSIAAPDSSLLVEVLDRLAAAESAASLRTSAIAHAERALAIRSTRSGNQSADAAIGTMKLGLIHANLREFEASERILRSAMQMARKARDDGDALNQVYAAMYALYSAQGMDTEAAKYLDLALGVSEAVD